MKVELDSWQQRQLDRALQSNSIRKFLINKDKFNFEVGDVLIKKFKRGHYSTGEWAHEPISSENLMPQRYVMIHKDEFGIIFMKQLKVSTGLLGKDIYCITDYDLDNIQFEVDPEYAEKIFLDAEFDIKDLHKKSLEARKITSKVNRKIGIKFKTLKESNNFFNGMQPGTKFWKSADYTGKALLEFELMKMVPVSIHHLESQNNWSWRHFKDLNRANPTVGIDDTFALQLTVKEVTSQRVHDAWAFETGYRAVLYKQKPAEVSK